jgi:hypothetical protein
VARLDVPGAESGPHVPVDVEEAELIRLGPGVVAGDDHLKVRVCQIFCAGDFFLSGSGCLSGAFPSRYLMPLCLFYPPHSRNRAFGAVPGLMLRVPVFFPSCPSRAPLP